jgi:hypothetical protein
MPSILYSTTCYIKNDLYRLRIYVDDQNENSNIIPPENSQLVTNSLDLTSIDIPINHIKPSLTRLNFELLDEKKINNNIPQTIILNYLLNVKQTTSVPRKFTKSFSNSLQTPSLEISGRSLNDRTTPVLEQSRQTSHITLNSDGSQAVLQRRQFSFRRFFSLSTNTDNEAVLFFKTLIKINYIDVSDSIRWSIKSLELEMDTEDIANELYANLNLCLSTLKQRPRRLLAFVNPLSGKGTKKLLRFNGIFFVLSTEDMKLLSNRRVNTLSRDTSSTLNLIATLS